MDKFIITIAEENGALSISLSGDGKPEGFARATAEGLMQLATVVVPKAVARAAARSDCQCEKCKAARAAQGVAPAESNPTIH